MRIAFYAPLKPPTHTVASGDRSMARNLMSAWRMAGHDIDLASPFRSYDAGDPVRQERLRLLGSRLAGRLLRTFESAGEAPDLWFTYHLYHKAPDWLGPAVAKGLGIPYFVAEASYAPKQAGGRWDLGHQAAAEALRRADRVFQLNPADAECVRPLLASPDRLVPLAPFLDTAPFRALDRTRNREASADRLRLPRKVPWLLTVAMMRQDQKLASYLTLANAVGMLMDLEWSLVIAGVGPAEPEVRAAFSRFGDRVCWVGMLDREMLLALYSGCDLYVWPAVKEAWGMALLEAQSAGLPVVAGRSGGVEGIVGDGETGLLVPEGDAPALAAATRTLLVEAPRRKRMRDAALSRTATHHDISVAAAVLDRHAKALSRA